MYLANEPSAMFHALHHAHRRQVKRAQADCGLEGLGSPMLLMTLYHAEAEGKIYSQRELAKQMRLSPATVAVSLKPLERDGYIRRRADDKDARRNLVELTAKGRQAVEDCGAAFRSVDQKMLEGFSTSEREQLAGFFQRMLENLGGPSSCPPPPPGVEGTGAPFAEKECDSQ